MSKREDILKAVISLSNFCHSPGEMTISAVAEHAGVGKGTVYEYFQSKEEMIFEAMRYFVSTRLGAFIHTPFQNGFREGFWEIIEKVKELYRQNRSFFQIIFLTGHQKEYTDAVSTQRVAAQRDEMFREMAGMLSRLVEVGRAEGIITADPDEKDVVFAFVCIASALCGVIPQSTGVFKGESEDDEFNFFYQKFVKLLN